MNTPERADVNTPERASGTAPERASATAPEPISATTPEQIKACCATAYEDDLVALVLGEAYHPGGAALTRRLAGRMRLRPGERVLDVACGPGGTALLLAREYGAEVDGIDYSAATVARATAAVQAAGLGRSVRCHVGDAEHLPVDDGAFDAVMCECALCTFPDKHAAAAEFARVLRPGGRAGITDVTVCGPLPATLSGLIGRIACLADARPLDEYVEILAGAGLSVTTTESHDEALTTMIDHIDARIRALRLTGALSGIDVPAVAETVGQARRAVADGTVGYALLVAARA